MKGKNNSHGKVVGIALLFSLMMVLSSISVSATATTGTRQDSEELILRVAMQDDMKGTNPITVSDVWSWNVLGFLFDGPIATNPKTDKLIPYIAVGSSNTSGAFPPAGATSFDGYCDIGNFGFTPEFTWGTNSENGEAIIYYDFENVLWHDNHQMDIKDIMFSMHFAGQVPEWSSSMNPLKIDGGGSGSNYSTTSWLCVYKVWESPDKLQAALKFVLQVPYADFFRGTLSTFLLPEHIWAYKTSGQNVDGALIWNDPGYSLAADNSWKVTPAQSYENNPPIGNGPFKFESWVKGQMSKVSTWREHFFRNDYKYSDYVKDEFGDTLAVQPNIDAITYKIYKTAEAAVLALKSKDIDYIAWSVPPTFVQELANEPGVALQQSPEQGFFYMAYNMRRTSFGYQDGDNLKGDVGKAFRKAVAHCIDKNRIVTRLLLNLGMSGEGPVSSISSWYNKSIPRYSFDPNEAKNILRNAGYKLTDGSVDAEGKADITKAVEGNWWLNPDGSFIGSADGGLIQILTPEANYDPIRAQAGLMIAQQLRDIGVNAKSVAMSFGVIVDRMNQRDFDMFILGWRIGSDPTDFLHAFFHSSMSVVGQNYPGYQNSSAFSDEFGYPKNFDDIIDAARRTGDEEERKNLVKEAQSSICYDLPYDVLYYRTNIEAYRSDRFTGWEVGSTGSIYNWRSIMMIKAPSKFKTNAQFISPPSAMKSNATTPITIFIKDQDGKALEGAQVWLETSIGSLSDLTGNTSTAGTFTTTFKAPWANPNDPEIVVNGTQAIIQIKEAKYTGSDGTKYDPAPGRLALIKVFPEGAEFLSISLSVDPDVIDPDIATDKTLGFANVEVTVLDQDGYPVPDSLVGLSASPAVPTITPANQPTDGNGKATFKVTATDLPNDDNSIVEYTLKAIAIHPTDTNIRGENQINLNIVDRGEGNTTVVVTPGGGTPFPTFLVVASVFCVAAVSYAVIRRRKK
jgi:ABC-type transport system substrate-binding protein